MGTKRADTLRKQLHEAVQYLSEDRLKVLVQLAKFLEAGESWEATAEILQDPEAVEAIREARQDLRSANEDAFISLEDMMQRVRDQVPSTSGAPTVEANGKRQAAH